MNENIYKSPDANVAVPPSKGNPLKAIFWGFMVGLFGTLLGGVIILTGFEIFGELSQYSEQEMEHLFESNLIWTLLLIDIAIFSMLSGYLTAKKSNYHEFKFCTALIIIGFVFFWIINAVLPDDEQESIEGWFDYAGDGILIIATFFGAWMWVRKKPKLTGN